VGGHVDDVLGGPLSGLEERRMAEHAVVIAGAGPTGLMLTGELALAGVDVALVEKRTRHVPAEYLGVLRIL
jgi:2-polyprenyl-6-methoxyphenol hydroxylase-like FAD-dependent oxidoreductase